MTQDNFDPEYESPCDTCIHIYTEKCRRCKNRFQPFQHLRNKFKMWCKK